MLEYVRKNIIKQVSRVVSALKKEDFAALKELSDHTIHSASVYQDQSSLVFALAVYSLSKVVERYHGSKDFDLFISRVIRDLEDSKYYLSVNDIDKYKRKRSSLLGSISRIDNKFRFYIEEVIDKARVKKGSKLYEHGLSVGRVADLLGISRWELMDYIGKTKEHYFAPAVSVADRFAFARKIFGLD